MEKIWKMANMYVATLRAIYLVHQNCHWVTKGPNFYSNHQLFERLYKSAQEDADEAAEEFIGLFVEESVDFNTQSEFLNKLLSKYSDYNGQHLATLGLEIEKDFLAYSKQVYDAIKNEDQLSDGLDDMLLSIAKSREKSCYLLKQTLGNQ